MSFNPKSQESKLNVSAKEYKPQVVYQKSIRYIGNPQDYWDICNYFITNVVWPPQVNVVYITNGWHTGWEPRDNKFQEVTYCGYAVNEDSEACKQHFYL